VVGDDKAEAHRRETYWIHHYTAAGEKLLNAVCVMQRRWGVGR
jgi:hypothetical protein